MKSLIKSRKGVQGILTLVVACIIAGVCLTVLYGVLTPAYTIGVVSNETFTMAAVPVAVNLANNEIVAASFTVYNATNTSLTVNEGLASAAECGGTGNDCYFNISVGSKSERATILVNQTGNFNISYSYYPAAYSHNVQDRTLIALISTVLILGVVVFVAKFYDLI